MIDVHSAVSQVEMSWISILIRWANIERGTFLLESDIVSVLLTIQKHVIVNKLKPISKGQLFHFAAGSIGALIS